MFILKHMPADVTHLLNRMQAGDRAAADEVVPLIYDELHRIAARAMRGERPGHLLQTTALIHEAYTRLAGSEAMEIRNRDHFFAIASRQMRRILVDIARSENAQRNGGLAAKVALDQLQIGVEGHSLDLLLLDDALHKLELDRPQGGQGGGTSLLRRVYG